MGLTPRTGLGAKQEPLRRPEVKRGLKTAFSGWRIAFRRKRALLRCSYEGQAGPSL